MQQRSRCFLFSSAALGALLVSFPAVAHIDLVDPPARAHGTAAGAQPDDENTDQKLAPCGQTVNGRTGRVTTYAPGETITVQVREETNHDSYIRVSLDLDGDDDFVYREPADGQTQIPPETQEVAQAAEEALDSETLLAVFREQNTENNTVLDIDVTLPNETCDNCTLQVIQLMYNTGQIYYHQCADLIISDGGTEEASPDAGLVGSGGAGGDAGNGGGVSGGASGTGPGNGSSSGGSGGSAPAVEGAGGAPASGGSTASAGAGALTGASGSVAIPVVRVSDEEDEGGCALAHGSRDASGAGLAGLLALGLGVVARRRR